MERGTTYRSVYNPETGRTLYYVENADFYRPGSTARNAWKRISAERYENAEIYSRCTGCQSYGPCYPYDGRFYSHFTITMQEA